VSKRTAQSLDQKTPPDLCEAFGVHVTGELSAQERSELGDYWAAWGRLAATSVHATRAARTPNRSSCDSPAAMSTGRV
jgi:hypothetical protein